MSVCNICDSQHLIAGLLACLLFDTMVVNRQIAAICMVLLSCATTTLASTNCDCQPLQCPLTSPATRSFTSNSQAECENSCKSYALNSGCNAGQYSYTPSATTAPTAAKSSLHHLLPAWQSELSLASSWAAYAV